ncbi:MAG TPA: purine-nucleoside phosphorylase [Candidatus Atribacteria bacterium]|nr:purine-nucleoside phosphorylase [Candidatus Atribacteria bacterium]
MDLIKAIDEAKRYIADKANIRPELGLILGSGLGDLADEIEAPVAIPYADIPHFPVSTVEGHAGRLVLGTLEGKKVIAMQGRFHFYEGYPMQDVVFPVRVMKALGADTLIVTNACGGMNPAFKPGDLMLIEDHINFIGTNPLIGKNYNELGPRFPDISRAYSEDLLKLAKETAAGLGIEVKSGVYCAISGPGYCTRAELRMLRQWGADAIGMSTVPEAMAAAHMSMKVLGVSCVTDMAIADELEPISHEIVMEMANKTKPKFIKLIKGIIGAMKG